MQKIKSIISIVLVCLMMLVNFPETIFAHQNHLDLLHSHEALCDIGHEDCDEHSHEHSHEAVSLDVNNDCDEHGHESLCNSGHEDCDSNCDESLCDSDHEECDDSICGCDLNAVKIAVFDTGINEVETSGSVSFVEDTEILSTHGNTIARNLKSMIPNAKLYDVRILNNNNEGTYSSLAKGIDWAVENGMDIISLSAIGFEASSIIEEALKKAEDNNILVIAAAGNESNDIPLYPAAYSTVISVGAVNEDDQITTYSNYGEYVDTYAIPLSEGTSFSTQSIVAKAAKIIESDPSISVKEIRKQITNGKIKNEITESNAVDGILYAAATCIHSFNGSYTTVKNATCTADGKKEGRCTKCGAVVSTVTIPALGHSYGSWTTTKAATCTTDGSRKRTCSRCSYVNTETIKATGHTFNGSYTTVKNATCTADGKKEGRCTKCSAVVSTVTIPALGHSYGSWTTTKAATCTTDGSRKRTCTRCSNPQTETIKATGHTFNGSYTTVKNATCTADGLKEGRCTKCSAVVSTASIPALGHSYGSWTTTKAETCTTDGSKKRTCTRCTAYETQTIKATGHNFNGSYTTAKEATCTTAGLKEGRCTKCSAVVSTASIPALGHSYGSWTTTKDATCTTEGTKKRTCTRCSAYETSSISATGHSFNGSYTTVKNPTCTEEGKKEGRCTRCSAVVSTVSIDALGHNYGSWTVVQAATCTTNGGKIGTCSRCSAKTSQSIPATGHSFNGSYSVEKEPTCTDEGKKVGRCINCNTVVSTVSIPALGGSHSFNGSYTTAKNATCTEEGRKEGKCTKCGAVVSTITIPKLDHDYGSWVVVQKETCTTPGGKIGTCSMCNGKTSQSIPATGHKFNGSYSVEKEPTCTDEGTKVGRCINCGAVVSTVSIPALGGSHSFSGSYTTVKNATCTEEGKKEGKCTKCGTVVSTVTIPKLEHDYSWVVVQKETCTTPGGKIGTCSKCNAKTSQSIPETGHKFNGSYEVEKEPTCTDEGTKVGKCENCGTVLSRASIPSLGKAGHTFNGSYTTTKHPTCTEKGKKEGKCTVCGTTVSTVDIPPLGGNHVFSGSFTVVKEATCTQDGRKEGRCTRCNSVISTISIPAGHSIISSTFKTSPGSETINGFNMEGSTIKVNATCSRCGNLDLTGKVAFTSSNESIAKVSNGKLTSGSKAGSAVITANYGSYKATCNVTVKAPWEAKLRQLSVTPSSQTITEFNKRGSKPKVIAIYDSGPQDVSSYATFTSSNSKIAYVDDEGYVKSGAITQGTATITAAFQGMTATCSVTVDMNGEPEKRPISLGKSLGFKIPDDLPVLGGTELKLGFDFIPATMEFGKEEFKIAIGVDDSKSVKENWKDFKKTIEDAKKSIDKAKQLRSLMKTFGAKTGSFSVVKGWKPDLDAYGYIEGVMVNGVPTITKGYITLMAEAKYSNETQYFIGPVPVYLEIGGGIKLEAICDILSFSKTSGQIKLKTDLKIKPRFEIGGGVGIANVVTVGGSGEAELECLIRTYEDYLKISLTGSLNLKAKALIFEAEKTIAKGTWILYESHKTQTNNYMALPPDEEKFNIYNNNEYSLMKRDYLNRSSEWYGDKSQYMSGIYSAPDFTNKDTKVLGTNVFPDAQPQLVNYGDGHILVWIADNPDRDSANRTMLVYSIYDKESNSWSEPVPIDDDGTADFYPKLASDGSNIYVVWQNSNTTFNGAITLEQVAKAGEIAVSKFNVESNTFTKPVIVTQNDLLDTLPQVVVNGDKAYITWISNNQNDIFGTKGKNSIYYSELEGDSWASPKLLCEGLNAVPSINAGFMNGSFTVAYVVDGDNNLETINDREVYAVQPGSASKRMTNNNILDSAPVFSVFNGRDALYWYSAGNICYVNGLDESPNIVFKVQQPGLSDEFQVLSGTQDELAIIWPNTSEGVTEIYSSIYNKDSGVWSDAVKISNTGSRLLSPSGVFDNDGNFKIAFNKITQLTNGSEQVDLCVTKITPSYNLTVDSVDVDHSKVIPGTKLEVNADVTNNGEIAVDEVIVEIIENGEAINSESVKVSINPGETKNVTVLMDLPETITKKTYSIRVTASEDEYNLSDNTKEFVIGYSDLSIEVDRYSENGIEYVTANIMNLSPVPSGAVLKVTKGSEDGEVIDTKVINNVEGIIKYEYKFDKNELCAGKDTEVLYFTVTANEEELYMSDNSKSIVINNEKAKISGYVGVNFNYSPDVEEQILSGFTVKVEGTDISTKTDANGYFEISDIPEDMKECTLEISKSGYLKRYVKVAGVGTGNTAVSSEDAPTVLWAGDAQIDGVQDGAINLEDLVQLAKAFNTESSDEQYVTDLDFNKDGVINMIDIFILIKNYNTASSSY